MLMSPDRHAFARFSRKHQMRAEDLLWERLRGSRFYGAKFRRRTRQRANLSARRRRSRAVASRIPKQADETDKLELLLSRNSRSFTVSAKLELPRLVKTKCGRVVRHGEGCRRHSGRFLPRWANT
jgi:hypothetical protein